jgi:hypothetical protein
MNFLNPLFFVGALAAAVPILLHLIKRERAQKFEFPTLMFLRRVSKRYIRFQKLRHLLLLLLRILALLFIAIAFTRPFSVLPQAATATGRISRAEIILLDNSLSMGHRDRWDRAKEAAAEIIRGVHPDDKVALLEFSQRTLARTQLSTDHAAVLSELENAVELTDNPTRFGQALNVAEKIAFDAGTPNRTIHLISDFQASGWASEERNFRLGSGIELRYVDVGSDEFSNLTLGDVRIIEGDEEADIGPKIRLSVVNFGNEDRKAAQVSLSLDGADVGIRTIDIDMGGVQGVEFQLPQLSDGIHEVTLEVEDPLLTRDNSFSLILETRGKTPVISIEGPNSGRNRKSASYFLANALNISALSPYRLSTLTPRQLESMDNFAGNILIWNNISGGSAALQRRLKEHVDQGGGLVVVLADSGGAADFDRTFGSWLPITVVRETESEHSRPSEYYALLTDLRMDHPIFRPFDGPHSGNFSSAKFYRHAKLSVGEGAEVLARFDNGDPALVSKAAGKGQVLVLASSADDASNDLPLKAVYAPLWQQMLHFVENLRQRRHWYDVGDTIAPRGILLEASARQGKGSVSSDQVIVVLDPDGRRVSLPAEGDAALVDKAGFYEIRSAGVDTRIAVNTIPRESDLTHGNAEEMAAGWVSGQGGNVPVISPDEQLSPEEQEKRQRFWRYLLLGALVFFLTEGWMANQTVLEPE